MTATRSTPAAKSRGRRLPTPKLPPVTVAKVEEIGYLLERVVATNTSLFVSNGQRYRDIHREGAMRPLSPLEAAQVAAALDSEDKLAEAEQIQQSGLRAYDEPDQREILFQAGIATAPAFLEAVRQVVALIEMPADIFEEACEDESLQDAIDTAAKELRTLEVGDGRKRAAAAFSHLAVSSGVEPGEAWRLPLQAVWQALNNATSELKDASALSQLIDSAASTAGTAPTSSTGSDGEQQSS